MKEIIIDNIKYSSINEASKKLDIPYSTINYRLKSPNFENYLILKRKPVFSGFCKKLRLSDEYCNFFNLEKNSEISRVELTRKINNYIKEKNLQNESNKRKINIHKDPAFKKLLNVKKNDTLTYFNLQRYIADSGAFPDKKIHKVNKSIIKNHQINKSIIPQVKRIYRFNSLEINQNIIYKKAIFHKNKDFNFKLLIKNKNINSFYKIEFKGKLEGDLELIIYEGNNKINKKITEKELINIIKKNKNLDFVKNYINSLHLKSNKEIII